LPTPGIDNATRQCKEEKDIIKQIAKQNNYHGNEIEKKT
jgi:hypothetical protein